MTRMTYFAVAAAALAFASPALAEGKAAPEAPAGFRIEALLGYDHSGISGFHKDGLLYGIGAGYDLAVGNTVSLGVDVEASGSTGSKFGVSAGRDLYAGGRVNFAVSPRANLYVKGGYTNGRVEVEDVGGENLDGWRIGAGGQLIVSGKTYVGLEYRYSNYEQDFDRHQVAVTFGTRF